MPYAIYLRKSRADAEAEARGEGETLSRHQAMLTELAHKRGLSVVDIYREIVSGESIAARPQMQELLAAVADGRYEGVLVVEVERLARGDTIDQGVVAQTFKATGTRIVTPAKEYNPDNPFDEEYFEFSLFMSRREYKTILRRMQAGRLASVKEGNYIGSIAPYGYVKVRDDASGSFTLAEHPEEAPVVRLVFDMAYEGDGSAKIATKLHDMGLHPRKGTEWTYASITGILHNPVYCGMLRWDWRPSKKTFSDGRIKISRPRCEGGVYRGKHPPLVSQEQYDAVQELGQRRSVPINNDRVLKNPYAGLIFCGLCGHAMTRKPNPGGRTAVLMCGNRWCTCISSDESDLTEAVLVALDAERQKLGAVVKSGKEGTKKRPTSDSVENVVEIELAKISKQRDKLYDLLERGVYDEKTFLDRMEKLCVREKDLTEQLGRKKAEKKLGLTTGEKIARISEVLQAFKDAADAETINKLLRSTVQCITYTKTRRNRSTQGGDMKVDVELLF